MKRLLYKAFFPPEKSLLANTEVLNTVFNCTWTSSIYWNLKVDSLELLIWNNENQMYINQFVQQHHRLHCVPSVDSVCLIRLEFSLSQYWPWTAWGTLPTDSHGCGEPIHALQAVTCFGSLLTYLRILDCPPACWHNIISSEYGMCVPTPYVTSSCLTTRLVLPFLLTKGSLSGYLYSS